MSTCVYDNPITCRREFWAYGKLRGWVSERIFYEVPNHILPYECMEPWVTGQIVGDPKAMEPIS